MPQELFQKHTEPMEREKTIAADPAQRAAIRHGSGPCAVIAGPGSGKTFVIVERIRQMIRETGIPASSILVLTFSRAAALQMRERFLESGPSSGRELNVVFSTFHSFFYGILRESLPRKVSIIDAGARRKYLQHLCDMKTDQVHKPDQGSIPGLPRGTGPEELQQLISRFKNGMTCSQPWVHELVREYDSYLEGRGWIDFDDMILQCCRLFREDPDVLQKWRSRFRWILVDEFQDVSVTQYELLRLLAAPSDNLFIVGDDDQSIYGFRGASPHTIQRFLEDYCSDTDETCAEKRNSRIFMTSNYRCGRQILEASAAVIRENTDRIDKDFRSGSGKEGEFSLRPFSRKDQQYLFIAGQLLEMSEDEREHSAVIFRTHAGTRRFLDVLAQKGISFRQEGSSRRAQLPSPGCDILGDILSYFTAAADLQGKGVSRSDLLRIMNRPERFLSGRFIRGDRLGREDLLMHAGYERASIEELVADLSLLQSLSPAWGLRYLLDSVGYREFAKSILPQAQELLNEIEQAASEQRSGLNWLSCLRELSAKAGQADAQGHDEHGHDENGHVLGSDNAGKKGVRILTMHACKGLEFDTVYIPDLNEGNIPSRRSFTEDHLEEERRLFYVAMTRAKNSLTITYLQGTPDRPAAPSRFLAPLLFPI